MISLAKIVIFCSMYHCKGMKDFDDNDDDDDDDADDDDDQDYLQFDVFFTTRQLSGVL